MTDGSATRDPGHQARIDALLAEARAAFGDCAVSTMDRRPTLLRRIADHLDQALGLAALPDLRRTPHASTGWGRTTLVAHPSSDVRILHDPNLRDVRIESGDGHRMTLDLRVAEGLPIDHPSLHPDRIGLNLAMARIAVERVMPVDGRHALALRAAANHALGGIDVVDSPTPWAPSNALPAVARTMRGAVLLTPFDGHETANLTIAPECGIADGTPDPVELMRLLARIAEDGDAAGARPE